VRFLMTRSTTRNSKSSRTTLIRIGSVAFWLLVWEVAARAIGEEIILVSPVEVLVNLSHMIVTASFWKAVWFSFIRIAGGFFLATLVGTVLAAASYVASPVRILLSPLVRTIKAIPVASFIILVLLWISSKNLSICISFLMVFPIIYTNVLEGLDATSHELIEMADLFCIGMPKRITSIYLSQVMPFFRSACSLGLGLAWKSGIAAEVIGIPVGSMGENLYQAKVFLATADLFSWTLVIVLVSVLFEHLVLALIDRAVTALERV
jgi:NitT/TauT family transport system permease protein